MSSFAGGKRDPSDKDVVDTALREAQEELGVTVAADRVWGVLKPLRDMVRTLAPLLHDHPLIYLIFPLLKLDMGGNTVFFTYRVALNLAYLD